MSRKHDSKTEPEALVLPGSRFTQARRWRAKIEEKTAKTKGLLTEDAITPEEARTACAAAMPGFGYVMERLEAYDRNQDAFHIVARDSDKMRHDVYLPGEYVGDLVRVARALAGRGTKALVRKRIREAEAN